MKHLLVRKYHSTAKLVESGNDYFYGGEDREGVPGPYQKCLGRQDQWMHVGKANRANVHA